MKMGRYKTKIKIWIIQIEIQQFRNITVFQNTKNFKNLA